MERKRKGGSLASKLYKLAANEYRKRNCNGKARPLLDGELHLLCSNFSGPGTRIDLPYVRNYEPYNEIDKCSRTHDFNYEDIKRLKDPAERALEVQKADQKAIDCYDKHKDEGIYQILAKAAIKGKLTIDKLISLLTGKPFTTYGAGLMDELKGKALSNNEILELVKGKANVVTYPELVNYKSIDQVLGSHGAAILLYESKKGYGHWIAIIKRDDLIEHFDPYGYFPDDELKEIDINFRKKNNEYYPLLTKLYYDSPYQISYNQYKLQKMDKGTATCGRWAAIRTIFKELPLDDFVDLFKVKGIDPDDLATLLTYYI